MKLFYLNVFSIIKQISGLLPAEAACILKNVNRSFCAAKKLHHVTHVIFDMDGVLLGIDHFFNLFLSLFMNC